MKYIPNEKYKKKWLCTVFKYSQATEIRELCIVWHDYYLSQHSYGRHCTKFNRNSQKWNQMLKAWTGSEFWFRLACKSTKRVKPLSVMNVFVWLSGCVISLLQKTQLRYGEWKGMGIVGFLWVAENALGVCRMVGSRCAAAQPDAHDKNVKNR